MPFTYRDLDPERDEIRLLKLHPAKNSGRVHCSIEHHSLDDQPQYVALSYTWGNPDITKPLVIDKYGALSISRDDPSVAVPIIIDQTEIGVTVNLEAALQQLGAYGYTKLWVDALCINQNNNGEKNAQVLKMKQIYKRARAVIV